MSRHINAVVPESFQMDLRSSPSQQHLNPSRSSSLDGSHDGGANDLDGATGGAGHHHHRSGSQGNQNQLEPRNHKLDLYSIPVFLLELLVLCGLAYGAYYSHFQYKHSPMINGFYCDDTSYRQEYQETAWTKQFNGKEEELYVLLTLLAVPILLILFCELVNSMFGSLKFRQVRALCTCCKLHSITRRTFRFTAAYLLGFLLVMISCDILANTTGRLRPYFAQDCPNAYQQCVGLLSPPSSTPSASNLLFGGAGAGDLQTQPSTRPAPVIISGGESTVSPAQQPPPSAPISASSSNMTPLVNTMGETAAQVMRQPSLATSTSRALGSGAGGGGDLNLAAIVERHWVSLAGKNLTQLCGFTGDHEEQALKSQEMAMSWPSSPGALFTYASLFVACYLSFVGTARPFRIITSIIVVMLFLVSVMFNVQLVKDHYHHWDDVASGAGLALILVVFVLHVYLNKFKDTHYYENQKLYKRKLYVYENNTSNKSSSGWNPNEAYTLDKTEPTLPATGQMNLQNGDVGGSISNNDLAMRYFQIPRANYRGGQNRLH